MVGFTNADGGGSGGSDECTATRENLLEGTTGILSDTDDEPAEGTMPDMRQINSVIGGVSETDSTVALQLGSDPKVTTPTNQSSRWFVISPPTGYYDENYVGMTLFSLSNVIGVNPSKMLESLTICDRSGTITEQEDRTNAVSASQTSDGLYLRIPVGAYLQEYFSSGYPEIRIDLASLRSAIGYTDASKVVNTTTIAGLKGTMANVGSVDWAKSGVISGDAFYMRMTNGAHITNASSGYPEVAMTLANLRSAIGYTNSNKVLSDTTIAGLKGTLSVSSLVSFSVAAYSTTQVQCTWKWPSKGPYSGVIICGKTGSYPTNYNDSRLYTGYGSSYTLGSTSTQVINNLTSGQTYYFRIWLYATANNSSGSANLYSGYLQSTCQITSHSQATIKSSQTWTVPEGVRSIDVLCVGGGGGGAGAWVWRVTDQGSPYPDCESGGGGAGGQVVTKTGISVTPGTKYTATIGAGGAGGNYVYTTSSSSSGTQEAGKRGGTTSLGSLCSAEGGPGASNRVGAEEEGHASGGTGARNSSDYGENGTAGTNAWGTVYGGGGGGGNYRYHDSDGSEYGKNGAGGSGGGGAGGYMTDSGNTAPVAGTANTGGGGGGGWINAGTSDGSGSAGASGGSGIIIIKW